MHISRVDLNLFIVFEAIYDEGSITRASQKMNLTQPAISHALGRLRELFGDPLFERRGHAMVPTPLARSIVDAVRQSLRGLELTLNGVDRFDPASARRRFTLALRAALEPSILPPLMARIAVAAPQVDLAVLQSERRTLESELAAGTLDAAIDVLLPLSADIAHTRIAADHTVVLARRGHPRAGTGLDLPTYLALEHILVSSRRRGPGLEDFELSRMGLQRRVRLRCQHYFAACRVVSQTDLVLAMPERYARVVNEQFGNQILASPLPLPAVDNHLYWHANVSHDPANIWLREQLLAVMLD
ncbi:LysR family transcriptional regulator [Janthinobacterium fluminis]|uniref:LysR family transcriptional regulator n=1 Tax=Janthinobacterium fluminis TaxID=2987524 RepID=A0ABT5JWX7_9BURK|nr:LysR family transcriptional regulator [Janthinobacterium fluminis]MDC8757064.1 LysR family transcriptional regulator [Janthinobacterium fluminis]